MAIKFLHDLDVHGNIDLKNNQSLNMVVQHLASDPGTVIEGKIYYNSASHVMMVGLNTGTAGSPVLEWVELSSSTGDITGVTAGVGMSGGGTNGNVTLTNADKGSSQLIFKNVASDSGTAVADTNNDTLSIVGGTNVTTSVVGDILTINASTQGDITGVTAGTGMTGGGTDGNVTLNVIGGDGITASADEISLTNGLIADGSNVTSVGTLGVLQVDNINIDGNTITSSTAADLVINVTDGQSVVIEGLDIDDGVVTGASSITSTSFVGDLTGNANTVTNGVYTTNNISVMAATTSAQLRGVLSDETGTGVAVFATSPTLVTPALGTPVSGVMTNVTGTASSLTAGNVTTNANLTGHITSVGNAAVLGSFTSAQLKTALTNETGSGVAVFATSPTLVTPALGTPASGIMTNVTGTATNLNIGGNAATATKIATITNANIVQKDDTQTLTNKTIAISQITELSGLTDVEGEQLENIGTTTIDATQWGYLGAATGAITNTDVDVNNDNLLTKLAALESAGGAADQNIVIGTDAGDTIVITGNLQVAGTTTTINSTTLSTADNNILLASENSTGAVLDETGFTFSGGTGDNVTLQWKSSSSTLNLNKGTGYAKFRAGEISGTSFVGDLTGNADTVTTNANLTGHITSVGNAAVLGSFTVAQLSAALSNASISGNNTGDQTNISGNAATVTTNANLTGHITSVGNAAVLGSFTSAQLKTALTNETGSGAAVFATSPTLVTPALGTPVSGVMTNVTGTASSLTAGNVTTNANLTGHITSVGNAAVLGSFTSAQLKTALTNETGSGVAVFATSPTLVTPALGTPASGIMTNVTGTASSLTAGNVTTNANLTGHITSVGNAAVLGSFTVAQLSTALSNASISGNNTGDETLSSINGLAITTVGTLSSGNATAIVSAASTSVAGKVELATPEEALAGTDTTRYVSPKHLSNRTFTDEIGDGNETAIEVEHNLGTLHVMVQMFDTSTLETVYAEVVRTSNNVVTVKFRAAPASGDVTVMISIIQ